MAAKKAEEKAANAGVPPSEPVAATAVSVKMEVETGESKRPEKKYYNHSNSKNTDWVCFSKIYEAYILTL